MDDAEPLKRLECLHKPEPHQHICDERPDAEREPADDSRLAFAPTDGEDASERNHDGERTRVESVDNSREDDGRKCPVRRGGGGLRLGGHSSNGNVDHGAFWVVTENPDMLRELARKHWFERDGKRRGGGGLYAR